MMGPGSYVEWDSALTSPGPVAKHPAPDCNRSSRRPPRTIGRSSSLPWRLRVRLPTGCQSAGSLRGKVPTGVEGSASRRDR